uniref:Uncharacterized protein n=1 Tax=Oryza punctata TaxID=4537 RepID=A0A0E0K0F7_ORYPU
MTAAWVEGNNDGVEETGGGSKSVPSTGSSPRHDQDFHHGVRERWVGWGSEHERDGAIVGDELVQWDKMRAPEAMNGGYQRGIWNKAAG